MPLQEKARKKLTPYEQERELERQVHSLGPTPRVDAFEEMAKEIPRPWTKDLGDRPVYSLKEKALDTANRFFGGDSWERNKARISAEQKAWDQNEENKKRNEEAKQSALSLKDPKNRMRMEGLFNATDRLIREKNAPEMKKQNKTTQGALTKDEYQAISPNKKK